MKSAIHAAFPPAKPVVVYDGDCQFCALWIGRWHQATGTGVDYLPFQDPRVAAQFPELPREQCEAALQLVQTDGSIYSGAEAAFGALAHSPHGDWLLDWYKRSPSFARATERAYRFVAEHRGLFSALTRLGWGRHVERPTHRLVGWALLRALGLIFLIAFVSLWVQILGLVGSQGILPAKITMLSAGQQVTAAKIGLDRYHLLPTLCWFNASDSFLKFQCAAGTALALLVIVGIAPAPCLFLLWLIYLSLATVCREFLAFQWDNLLLEAGFLAIFLAPLQWLPRFSRAAPPSRLVLWLLRWLLFRLMFESGCVKLLSHDPAWRNLTALAFHYETQCLPTWIGWYAHQLPLWVQKASAAIMFGIELGVPFLIFGPRRFRQLACVLFIALQALIFLTGNYCFFNLLTVTLCLSLLDDGALGKLLPASPDPIGARWRGIPALDPQPSILKRRQWPRPVTVALTGLVVAVSLMQFSGLFRIGIPWPPPMPAVYQWLAPLRTFNSYGLFAVMTTSRPEIILEGSNDGVTWLEYEFKYKAGDVKQRPRFVEPHQPRLDWQMWFAALGDYRDNPWLPNFGFRLLQGSPEVLALIARNPFPQAPPRYLRAVVYDYHFTDFATRRKTGAWWRRELKGDYFPVLSLRSTQ